MRVSTALSVLFVGLAIAAPAVSAHSRHHHRSEVSSEERYTGIVNNLLESDSFRSYLVRHPEVADAFTEATYSNEAVEVEVEAEIDSAAVGTRKIGDSCSTFADCASSFCYEVSNPTSHEGKRCKAQSQCQNYTARERRPCGPTTQDACESAQCCWSPGVSGPSCVKYKPWQPKGYPCTQNDLCASFSCNQGTKTCN